MANDVEVIGLAGVMQVTGIGRSKIFEMSKAGEFPPQAKLGGRASQWWRCDVEAWLLAKQREQGCTSGDESAHAGKKAVTV